MEAAGVVNASVEAAWLLESASGLPRTEIVALKPQLDEVTVERLAALVARRTTGEPIQYITGVAGFRHLELAVGEGVFIPRPETELVAELAMSRLVNAGTVVDVGTGSGALALAIAQERPDAAVWATEISPAAMAWAKKNRDALGLPVELVQGDLLEDLPEHLAGAIDVVVGNMPYVPAEEAEFLPADVVAYEPAVALFGSTGGLEVVARLAETARAWLRPGGRLVLEIGHGQAAAVEEMLRGFGYDDVASHDDLAGRERMADAVYAR